MDFYRRFNSFKVSRKQQALLWKGGAVPFQPLPHCMELVAGIQVQWDRLERQTQRSPRVRPCPRLTSFPLSFWTPEACYNHQSQQLSFRACALRLTGMKDLCHLSTERDQSRRMGNMGDGHLVLYLSPRESSNWVGWRPWGLSGLDFQH